MDDSSFQKPGSHREPFRAHLLQALVLVLTGLSVLFGLLAARWVLGALLLLGHALTSIFLANAIWNGDRRRRDFALVCVTPNIVGYVFALGGMFGGERWLLISLAILTTLAVIGIARRVPAAKMLDYDRWLGWLPIVGGWLRSPGADPSWQTRGKRAEDESTNERAAPDKVTSPARRVG